MLPIKITRCAAAQIRKAAGWWSTNRLAAPNALKEELANAFMLISHQPEIGAAATNVCLAGVRRIYLDRVRYFLYYRARATQIEILALWHSSRGKGPRL
jgi:plasmid stabilization system protein ParE